MSVRTGGVPPLKAGSGGWEEEEEAGSILTVHKGSGHLPEVYLTIVIRFTSSADPPSLLSC